MKRHHEFLARAVLVEGGCLLVCRNRRRGTLYLPGGHIEVGEGAREALERELREETGLRCKAGRFLSAVEHTFVRNGKRTCEINMIFSVACPAGRRVGSREKKIEFVWMPLGKVPRSALQPACIRKVLATWMDESGAERWASSCE